MRWVEFDTAFKQELGLVKRPVASRDFREQAHSLDVGPVGLEEVFAEALGVRQTVVRQVADDGEKFGWQRFQKDELILDSL